MTRINWKRARTATYVLASIATLLYTVGAPYASAG